MPSRAKLLAAALLILVTAYGATGAGLDSTATSGTREASLPNPNEAVRTVLASSVKVILGTESKGNIDDLQSSSGVVIYSAKTPRPWSLVLTNAHAVDPTGLPKETRTFVSYLVPTGRRIMAGSVIARGEEKTVDLALVRVEGVALPAAQFEDLDNVQMGDSVLVASSPFGKELSITSGIVSQKYLAGPPKVETCAADAQSAAVCLADPMNEIFKTDAPICYGSSGGGVFLRSTGRLVGVVESYQSADLVIKQQSGDPLKFQIPVPGESFLISVNKIRLFLKQQGVDLNAPQQGILSAQAEKGQS